jgi:ATP-binding cassette subfamily B protein
MHMFRHSALFQSMIPLMGSLSFAIALLFGGYLTVSRQISLGSFVAFTLYLAMLITPLQQMGFVFNYFQRAAASLKRLQTLLAERPEIVDAANPVPVDSLVGDIEFRLSSYQFADADAPVLQDVHFRVKAGQTVGIVGRTAAGKTTLVNMLPRIFDPPAASIFVDGYDVRDVRLETLRSAIAYVPQDGFLFSTTVEENIGFAKAEASSEEIRQAATDAAMLGDIEMFEHGFATVIGERGVTLSGGQKQRTALARAFLKDAPILILDDSLSAVDMDTEKRIIRRIEQLRIDKTTLIVAHRLSAVRHADCIVVLDEGSVAELGTHQALLDVGGIYAQMHALQEEGAEVAVQ